MLKSLRQYINEKLGVMNIGRNDMPQIHDHDKFLGFLTSRAITYTQGMYPVDKIIPIQADINQDKVQTINTIGMRPIIISNGWYILDGHHRYFASVLNDHDDIEAIEVDQDINQLLISANEYVDSGGSDD